MASFCAIACKRVQALFTLAPLFVSPQNGAHSYERDQPFHYREATRTQGMPLFELINAIFRRERFTRGLQLLSCYEQSRVQPCIYRL
jgi:hypothetical protein